MATFFRGRELHFDGTKDRCAEIASEAKRHGAASPIRFVVALD